MPPEAPVTSELEPAIERFTFRVQVSGSRFKVLRPGLGFGQDFSERLLFVFVGWRNKRHVVVDGEIVSCPIVCRSEHRLKFERHVGVALG
jgi:hypothetical protein